MYFHRLPFWIKYIWPNVVWRIQTPEKSLYLSFDDGPSPVVTEELLDILKGLGAHATFFCLGKNAEAFPLIMERIKAEGHSLGHHSYSHFNGWNTPDEVYFSDVSRGASATPSLLFRPPYGKMSSAQFRKLRKEYRIVMWTLLTGDFEPGVSAEKCLKIALHKSCSGDIVVFHDNEKCGNKMLSVLPLYIAEMQHRGFTFKNLDVLTT